METQIEKKQKTSFWQILKWTTVLIWALPFLIIKTHKLLYRIKILGWTYLLITISGTSIYIYSLFRGDLELQGNLIPSVPNWVWLIILCVLIFTECLFITVNIMRRKDVVIKN